MRITFYTTNCPKCEILKNKLDAKNIPYEVCRDINVMMNQGLKSAPALEIDNVIYNFKEAIKFINNLEVI